MQDKDKQLSISFDHDELLPGILSRGRFVTFVELTFGDNASENMSNGNLVRLLSKEHPRDLAFAIQYGDGFSVTSLKDLKQSTALPFLQIVSGVGKSLQAMREEIAQGRSFGIRNFLPVTGGISANHLKDENGKYPVFGENGYTDDVTAIEALVGEGREQSIAAFVNPYKYTPETQSMQLAKLLRKISRGASFIVSQGGWDAAKAQELQWNLQMRDCYLPAIVRMRFFSVAEALNLQAKLEPGLVMPTAIGAKLQRLAAAEPEAFWEYQLGMNALLAVGYQKFGYGGIQLAGIKDAELYRRFFAKFNELNGIIQDYDEWLDKWKAFHGDIYFGPPPSPNTTHDAFYVFSNLLEPHLSLYSEAEHQLTRYVFPEPPALASFRAQWASADSDGLVAKIAKLFHKPAEACNACYGLDNSSCPKRLLTGPCENCRPDGYCEAGHAPCFFNTVAQLAVYRNEMKQFEM